MTYSDTEYYRQREQTERDVARHCADPAIASIHLDLADRYAGLVRQDVVVIVGSTASGDRYDHPVPGWSARRRLA